MNSKLNEVDISNKDKCELKLWNEIQLCNWIEWMNWTVSQLSVNRIDMK